jgi:hypothetical protein
VPDRRRLTAAPLEAAIGQFVEIGRLLDASSTAAIRAVQACDLILKLEDVEERNDAIGKLRVRLLDLALQLKAPIESRLVETPVPSSEG